MLPRPLYRALTVCIISSVLGGCVGAIVTGAATGVAIANDRRTAGTLIEDNSIELKAGQLLRADNELYEQTHINVTAYNLKVLLSGEAPTPELRNRVVDIVRDIRKVEHVYNEITVAAPSSMVARSNDTLLTTKVKTKLFGIKDFDSTRVKVVTENGVVYMMGLLKEIEANAVTEAARRISGVLKVVKLFEYIK